MFSGEEENFSADLLSAKKLCCQQRRNNIMTVSCLLIIFVGRLGKTLVYFPDSSLYLPFVRLMLLVSHCVWSFKVTFAAESVETQSFRPAAMAQVIRNYPGLQ